MCVSHLKKKCPNEAHTHKKKTRQIQGRRWRDDGALASALLHSHSHFSAECVYRSDNEPLLLSVSKHTHTHGPPPLLPQAVQSTETHTHTLSGRGIGPAPLFLCALVTKESWLPLPLFLMITRSLSLSFSLYTLFGLRSAGLRI